MSTEINIADDEQNCCARAWNQVLVKFGLNCVTKQDAGELLRLHIKYECQKQHMNANRASALLRPLAVSYTRD